AGEPRRSRTHHRDLPARRRRALEWMPLPRHQRIGRMTLQPTDLDRPTLGLLAHAGAFAEVLGRADPRTDAAHYVRLEDRQRRRFGLARLNLADEQRHVDLGRTG